MVPYKERLAIADIIYGAGMERVRTTPAPVEQKFPIGSFVKLDSSCLYPSQGNVEAMVEYTYAHAFGGDNIRDYCLLICTHLPGSGRSYWIQISWFREDKLTLITDTQEIAILQSELADFQARPTHIVNTDPLNTKLN